MHHPYGQQHGTLTLQSAQQSVINPLLSNPQRWCFKQHKDLLSEAAGETS